MAVHRWLGILAILVGAAWTARGETPVGEVRLFDGKSLKGWKITEFGGQGEVHVEEGKIVLEMGSDLTGITIESDEKLLKQNYEITLEAMRLAGSDFFCGLTFPVDKECCSLIVGGWGGGLVGISSLDARDASENQTGGWHEFNSNKWYKIRLWVEPKRLRAWIDDKKVVDVDTEGKQIGIRGDVQLSKPLGIATWRTMSAVRGIQIRPLSDADRKAAEKDDDADMN